MILLLKMLVEIKNINKTSTSSNNAQHTCNTITNTYTYTNTINTNQCNKQIKLIQISLHNARGASAVLHKKFTESKLDIALIQEPWTNNNKVLGLPETFNKLIYNEDDPIPRTAILVNSRIKCLPITEFIRRDIVVILIEVPTSRGLTEMYVASAYFPGDSEEIPPPDVLDFVSYCKRQNKPFIIGCDANAHHTVWNSTDVNTRGEYLLEYITNNNIEI